MHSVAAEEAIENVLALHDEMRNRTMEQSHNQSQNQSREVRYHAPSLAVVSMVSIRRRT